MGNFLTQAVFRHKTTGAIAPSSKRVAEFITEKANLPEAGVVVELGPGSGVVTEKILQKINGNTIFFAMEINPDFVKETKKRCPNAIVYNDSAANLKKYLLKHNVDKCDSIISTLPFSILDETSQKTILSAILDCLKPGGSFFTIAYIGGLFFPPARRFKKMAKSNFRELESKLIWGNIPPTYVYHART